MVDMRMRENDGIQLRDRQRQLPVLVCRFLSATLEHPAVQSYGVPVYTKKVTGAGYFTCCADERYFQLISLLPQHRAETES